MTAPPAQSGPSVDIKTESPVRLSRGSRPTQSALTVGQPRNDICCFKFHSKLDSFFFFFSQVGGAEREWDGFSILEDDFRLDPEATKVGIGCQEDVLSYLYSFMTDTVLLLG